MIKFISFTLSLFLSLTSLGAGNGAPEPWQINFQQPATDLMSEVIDFHNFLMVIITGIVVVVLGLLTYICIRFSRKRNPIPSKFSHNVAIEIIWTLIPVIILCVIAVPSFRLLKEEVKMPPAEFTIKVIGYQWYWNYQFPDHGNFSFDSYMLDKTQLQPGQHRLLDVDNRIVIPENTVVRLLITAGDVIHSFAVPSFGIKTDAVPGRVNETWIKVNQRGVYYGQCSELCGVNHGFMPIAIEVVSKEEFNHWIEHAKQKFAQNKFEKLIALKK